MNRSERRRMLKDQKKYTEAEMQSWKHKVVDRAQAAAWETIMPIFLLYLVDHFHCKKNGVQKFIDWFNEIDEWVGGDKKKLESLLKEVSDRADMVLEFAKR